MGVTVVTLTSEGRVLDQAYAVLSLEIRKELDRIPEARLTLLDGSVAAREFTLSDTPFFAPGKRVQIALRHEGEGGPDRRVFDGLVVRHAVEARAGGRPRRSRPPSRFTTTGRK
jgi:hypothetical protein